MAFAQVLAMYQIYHILIHLLYHSPSFPIPPIPGVVSIGIIFAFTYTCPHIL
jgi:uncharacterized membrane protein (DUF485 family)